MLVGEYNYCYSVVGGEPDRKIEFTRDKKSGTITTVVKALSVDGWKITSQLNGDQINIQMMLTSEKIRALTLERQGKSSSRKPDQNLTQLTPGEQESILKFLEPSGDWRIEITNDVSKDSKFETVVHLDLFNPS
ncbi:MAG: hypothetical protein K940chlam7_00741 [Chlamydiae bacterium]|nr:hypothetical protein [Chlamydiota bacterium]